MPVIQAFTPDPDPLGQQWLSALVASVPILVMLLMLGGLRWRAHVAGLTSWAVALVIAIAVYAMPVTTALSLSLHGFVYGLFPIVWILLCAIWMYQVTVISGRFDDLRATFYLITDDPRVLGLIIAFCFGGLLEALAGFGAPVAIVSVMLVAIGYSPIRAAITALLANTVPVAFGAVGLPILMAAKTADMPVLSVSPVAGRICALLSVLVPLLLLYVIDGKKGVVQCWPIGLFIGVIFGLTKWVVSGTSLYNLTEVFAAVITVVAVVAFLRVWHPKGGEEARPRVGEALVPDVEEPHLQRAAGGGTATATATSTTTSTTTATSTATSAPQSGDADAPRTGGPSAEHLTTNRILMALVPYVLVIVVFSIAAIPAVKSALASTDLSFAWPGLSDMRNASGAPASHQSYHFTWLSSPGTLLAFVAIAVGLIYKVPMGTLFGELWKNAVKLKYTALTIGSVVALAFVMGDSGQTLALGLFIAGVGAAYPFFAPILGWIGTYVTGSDTSANILFSGLQAGVGDQIGHKELLVGAGAAGGVVGKMISPQSLAVAASAIGIAGAESIILRRVFGYSILLLFFMCLLTGLMSTPVLGWLLP